MCLVNTAFTILVDEYFNFVELQISSQVQNNFPENTFSSSILFLKYLPIKMVEILILEYQCPIAAAARPHKLRHLTLDKCVPSQPWGSEAYHRPVSWVAPSSALRNRPCSLTLTLHLLHYKVPAFTLPSPCTGPALPVPLEGPVITPAAAR